MFGKKKKNSENGNYKRLLKALNSCLKDDEKNEKLAELFDYSIVEIKNDKNDLENTMLALSMKEEYIDSEEGQKWCKEQYKKQLSYDFRHYTIPFFIDRLITVIIAIIIVSLLK